MWMITKWWVMEVKARVDDNVESLDRNVLSGKPQHD